MALDDDSGTTFFLGRKRGAKRWENQDFTGRNHEIRWRLAGFPPAKTVMCGFDFRQKIGESLGNLRMFRDCLAAKIHFKKIYGDFNIKKKQKRDLEVTPWGILYPDRSCHVLSKKTVPFGSQTWQC